MLDLAFLFRGELLFGTFPGRDFCMPGHDTTEGLDFSDDVSELEILDLLADFIGVFVGDGSFAQIGLSVEPTDLDVAGMMIDEVLPVVGGGMESFERGAGEVATGTVGREGEELFVVFPQHDENGFRHVERDQPQEWSSAFILPGRSGAFAVVEMVAAFPDKVVFVSEAGNFHSTDAIEKTGVDALMVGSGPAGDVLQGFPVIFPDLRIGVEPGAILGNVIGNFRGVLDGGSLSLFVKMCAEAPRSMVSYKSPDLAAKISKVDVACFAKFRNELVGDDHFSDESEVISVALIRDVNASPVLQSLEERILPNFFVEDIMMDEVIEMTATRTKAGGRCESIELLSNLRAGFVKGGEHGATNIRGVSGRNDGIFRHHHATHRDGLGSGRAGVGHDRAFADYGTAHDAGHDLADLLDIGFLLFGVGTNGFTMSEWFLAHHEFRHRCSKIPLEELEEVLSFDDATCLILRDAKKHFVELRSRIVSGFDEVF